MARISLPNSEAEQHVVDAVRELHEHIRVIVTHICKAERIASALYCASGHNWPRMRGYLRFLASARTKASMRWNRREAVAQEAVDRTRNPW